MAYVPPEKKTQLYNNELFFLLISINLYNWSSQIWKLSPLAQRHRASWWQNLDSHPAAWCQTHALHSFAFLTLWPLHYSFLPFLDSGIDWPSQWKPRELWKVPKMVLIKGTAVNMWRSHTHIHTHKNKVRSWDFHTILKVELHLKPI